MPGKKLVYVQDGAIRETIVRQPPAPRPLRRWLLEAAREALRRDARHFALLYGKEWHVHHAYGNRSNPYATESLRAFPNKDAAGMWMLHTRRGGAPL